MARECYGIGNQFTLAINREVLEGFLVMILNDNLDHTGQSSLYNDHPATQLAIIGH